MLMSAARAEQLGLPVLARIAAYANAGVDPAIMGIGPVSATRRCLDKAGWSLADLDLIEANEAFAAQSLSVGKELGLDPQKLNVNGGAIALGHPIGASGCRVLVTLLHEMIRRDVKKGLATLCIGGGQGLLWRWSVRAPGQAEGAGQPAPCVFRRPREPLPCQRAPDA